MEVEQDAARVCALRPQPLARNAAQGPLFAGDAVRQREDLDRAVVFFPKVGDGGGCAIGPFGKL